MNPASASVARGPARLPGVATGLLACGWTLFIAAFFLAPDRHELRLAFNWGVLLPTALALPWLAGASRLSRLSFSPPRRLALAAGAMAGWLCLSSLWGASAGIGYLLRELENALLVAALVVATHAVARMRPRLIASLEPLIVALGCAAALAALAPHLAPLARGETAPLAPRLAGLGILRNELVLASVLGVAALCAVAGYYRSMAGRRAVLWLLPLAPVLAAMLASLSRGPLLALLVALPLLAALARVPLRRHLAPIGGALLAAVLLAGIPELVDHALARGLDPSHRDVIWRAAIDETAGDWLFGQGLREQRGLDVDAMRFGHAHSSLLSVYRFAGAVGVALFVAFLAELLRAAAALPAQPRLTLLPWLVYGILCQLSNGAFPLARPSYDWLLLWVPMALCIALRRPRAETA